MDNLKYIGCYALMVAVIWGGGVLFSRTIKDYEVIAPEKNIRCVVVSRMFNTSVDCWKEKDNG